MNKYILTLSGSLDLEYDESGSKKFNIIINLPNNKKHYTGYEVLLTWKDLKSYKDPYYVVYNNNNFLKMFKQKNRFLIIYHLF